MKNTIFWSVAIIAIAFLLYLNFFSGTKDGVLPAVIFTDKAPKPIGPYSQAYSTGNVLFVSGQVGIDAITGELDSSSIENETKKVLENIRAILVAAKMDLKDVVKCTIYLTDLGDFKQVNAVYGDAFKKDPPARETVQVCALPKGAHIEISVIAVNQ